MNSSVLHTRVAGNGPPIVFLHGLGASSRYWPAEFDELSDRHHLAFLDLLGFGRSPMPSVSYDLKCHLDALNVTLAALGEHGAATFVGHSLGALLALAFAAERRNHDHRVIAFGLPAYPSPESARRHIGSLSAMARMTVEGSWMARAMCYSLCAARPVARLAAPLIARDVPAEVARDGVDHTWTSYSGSLDVIVNENGAREWASVLGPRLTIIQGIADAVAPPDAVRETIGDGTAARLLTEPGDHHLPLRRATRCVALTRESLGAAPR